MSQCPLCHAPVQDDFGLIECSGCSAQLIVHMDGRVEHQGAHESAEPEEAPQLEALGFPEAEAVIDLDEIEQPDVDPVAAYEATQMKAAEDFVPPESEGAGYRMPEDDPLAEEAYVEDSEDHIAEEVAPEDQPPDVPAFDGNEESGEAPAAVYNSAELMNSPDLTDVARFGNSDISGGRDGSLRYNLFIEGIDTSDVREAFREALTDRKLMWDTDQILRTIRNGRVSIPNVAPTKAYILISRLRAMPVQVRWEQYAISQT